ncbi:hypothetical protein ACEPAI_7233 [Sanghuangporus weigelae]
MIDDSPAIDVVRVEEDSSGRPVEATAKSGSERIKGNASEKRFFGDSLFSSYIVHGIVAINHGNVPNYQMEWITPTINQSRAETFKGALPVTKDVILSFRGFVREAHIEVWDQETIDSPFSVMVADE